MLNLLAVFLVCSGIGIAVHIAIDLTHRPQSMKIMNAVWILTALWGSYLALWAYNKFGQGAPMKMGGGEMKMDMSGMKDMNMDMSMGDMSMKHPHWQSVALSALHCGAGCTLADIIGEWFTNYIPVTVASEFIFNSMLFGRWRGYRWERYCPVLLKQISFLCCLGKSECMAGWQSFILFYLSMSLCLKTHGYFGL